MRDGERAAEDRQRTEDEWNPGGVGNAEGRDLATPSSTWNPGGTGNTGNTGGAGELSEEPEDPPDAGPSR